MSNTPNTVARSIGRLLAMIVFVVIIFVAAVLTGIIPLSFAP